MSRGRNESAAAAGTRTRRALVMGLGSFGGGLGATRFLAQRGWDVTVTDLRSEAELAESLSALDDLKLTRRLGGHRKQDFEDSELVVANPAVAPNDPLLVHARGHGARVTTEIELFLNEVDARVVCVTGTQGKSSTCHLLAGLLQSPDRAVYLGGNIGGSLLGKLDRLEPHDVVVLELSSYQLEALAESDAPSRSQRGVEVVCVTNVTPDHLERHGDMKSYAAAKRHILELVHQDGVALLPENDPVTNAWSLPRGARIGFSTDGDARLTIRAGSFQFDDEELAPVASLALPGVFQRANALVALGAARCMGVPPERLARLLPDLSGLEHRLEFLGTFGGRRVHDNGVSTTPDSTLSALRSIPSGMHWIAGGRRKALPLDELARVASERVSRAVCFGEAREDLRAALERAGVNVVVTPTLEGAVRDALEHAPPGSNILFSPACSSFDAFPNFRARALAFRSALMQGADE